MNSRQVEDENGVIWTATIKLGKGKAAYGSSDFKLNSLVFTTVDKRVSCKYKDVATEKSSINDFTDEELKKELRQPKP